MNIPTSKKRQVIDITDDVSAELHDGDGIVTVFVKHSTAAISTADLDPGTDEDFLTFLEKITPSAQWQHPHDPSHAPDHLLAGTVGPQVTVPFSGGKLDLGTWQRIVLVELDGPRERTIVVRSIS